MVCVVAMALVLAITPGWRKSDSRRYIDRDIFAINFPENYLGNFPGRNPLNRHITEEPLGNCRANSNRLSELTNWVQKTYEKIQAVRPDKRDRSSPTRAQRPFHPATERPDFDPATPRPQPPHDPPMTDIMIPYSLLVRGLSYQERPEGWVWHGVTGGRTLADPAHGLPYAADRLVFLELATLAARSGKRIQCKPTDIKTRYDLASDIEQIIESAHRVGYSSYEAPEGEPCCPHQCNTLRRRVAVAEHVSYCPRTESLAILLSDHFVQEARTGAPGESWIVAELARKRQIGALDVYLAIAWELHTGPRDRVPLFDNGHLFGVLRAAQTSRRALQQARDRWYAVKAAAPEIPFRFRQDKEGAFLIHTPQPAKPVEKAETEARPGEQPRPESDPRPGREQTWTDEELAELRKARGVLTELPWHRKPSRTTGPADPPRPAQPGKPDTSDDD